MNPRSQELLISLLNDVDLEAAQEPSQAPYSSYHDSVDSNYYREANELRSSEDENSDNQDENLLAMQREAIEAILLDGQNNMDQVPSKYE